MVQKALVLYNARFRVVFALVLLLLIAMAWYFRFVQDDAFISFRYAQNLVNGQGLVWNPRERLEGYTNFLWTLMIAGGLRLGIEPVLFTYITGLLCFAVTLLVAFKLAELILGSRDWALLTTILLGTNYSFSAYATGGLETQLQACLFASTMFVALRALTTGRWSVWTMVSISLLLSAAILTRPDSVLLAVVVLPIAVLHLLRSGETSPKRIGKAVALAGPMVVILGTWLAWKLSFYGALLPNSYYAKASSGTSVTLGLRYVYSFLLHYWLLPFPLLFLAVLVRTVRRPNARILIPLVLICAWTAYVVKVGGDFMEFRMLVPMMPLAFALLVFTTVTVARQPWIRTALIVAVLAGSGMYASRNGVFHRYGQSPINRAGIETVPQLQAHVADWGDRWCQIGKVLNQTLGSSDGVVVAIWPAGAIPYYSRLRCVDMLGINDAWVARNGIALSIIPGHRRITTFQYMRDRNVNLIIGYPLVARMDRSLESLIVSIDAFQYFGVRNTSDLPQETKALEIPIGDNHKLIALYIRPHRAIDRAIREYGWAAH